MDNSKGGVTMISSCVLSMNTGSPIENESEYRSIVGALQYIVITRPEIAFAANRATIDHGVCFTAAPQLSLTSYSDASWGDDLDDRQSTSGFCIFLGGNPVSWGFKKQQAVSRSSVEAEYKSLAHATTEASG
ncbi:uncharacterized mitochondrial protein AtMg00810-like [Gossypium raimondii]|uniref:uncharacterized mitochondrial protein AtMg00810-like n=1 Tax=Gossypium raimondii TaxID=29730 RepID=UPI00227CC611|nr:uncharacterized mitochondrial protein AtMg00810-like [Gossypium raimondii]